MQSILRAFFAPEALGLVLLAVVGAFIFLLLRPRQLDPSEKFWLAFLEEYQRAKGAAPKSGSRPDMPKAGEADQASDDRAVGLFPF